MWKLGGLELGAVPRIAVPFGDREGPEAIAAARRAGMDVAELRADRFASCEPAHLEAVAARFAGIPTIGTIRSADEGGGWRGGEPARLEAFRALLPHVDAVDVELAARQVLPAVAADAKERGALLIVSHHDFAGCPDAAGLVRIADEAAAAGADLVKIAATPAGPGDLRALAALCAERAERGLIAIGMGEWGVATRLLLPALGSLLTFAALDSASATAPGQLPLAETRAWLERLNPAYAAAQRGG